MPAAWSLQSSAHGSWSCDGFASQWDARPSAVTRTRCRRAGDVLSRGDRGPTGDIGSVERSVADAGSGDDGPRRSQPECCGRLGPAIITFFVRGRRSRTQAK